MNTIAVTHRNAYKAPVSGDTRAPTALAVVALVGAAWLSAGTQSHYAVESSTAALSRTYITLPTVEIVAQREGKLAPVASATARPAGQL